MKAYTHRRVAKRMSPSTLFGPSDVEIADLSASPSSVAETDEVTFEVTVNNSGSESVYVNALVTLGANGVARVRGTVSGNSNGETLSTTRPYQEVLNIVSRPGDYQLSANVFLGSPPTRNFEVQGGPVSIEEQASGGGDQPPEAGTVTMTGVDRSLSTVFPTESVELYAYYTNELSEDVDVTTTFYLDGNEVDSVTYTSPSTSQDHNHGTTVSYQDLLAAVGSPGYYRLSATADYASLDKTDELTDGQIRVVDEDNIQDGDGDGGGSDGGGGPSLPALPGPTIPIMGMEVPVIVLVGGGLGIFFFLLILLR